MTSTDKQDWRTDYVICEHVAENADAGTRHSGFRVCCEECWKTTLFLQVLDLRSVTRRADGLTVGRA